MPTITETTNDRFDTPEKARALAKFLSVRWTEIDYTPYGQYEYGSEEYLVLTDSEADEAQDESLDSYLEECIYPELPAPLSNYFDDEAWKRDARLDGRGHCLATYDGDENEQTDPVTKEYFFIYRTN